MIVGLNGGSGCFKRGDLEAESRVEANTRNLFNAASLRLAGRAAAACPLWVEVLSCTVALRRQFVNKRVVAVLF